MEKIISRFNNEYLLCFVFTGDEILITFLKLINLFYVYVD